MSKYAYQVVLNRVDQFVAGALLVCFAVLFEIFRACAVLLRTVE